MVRIGIRTLACGIATGVAIATGAFVAGRHSAQLPSRRAWDAASPRRSASATIVSRPGTAPDATEAEQALISLCSVPPSPLGDRRIADELAVLSRDAPDAVLAFIASAFPAGRATSLRSAVLAAWAERDAPTAWAWAQDHGGVPALLHGLNDAGDYRTGLELAEQAPAGPDRKEWLSEVLLDWSRFDPGAAGPALLALPASADRDATITGVLQRWLESDPPTAAALANQLPAGALRQRAFAQIASTWVPQDPGAASAWAAQLPPGPDADPLAVALATEPDWLPDHPDWALVWSNRIADDEARFNSIGVILRAVARQDPAGAQGLLTQKVGLNDDQRRSLMELLREP